MIKEQQHNDFEAETKSGSNEIFVLSEIPPNISAGAEKYVRESGIDGYHIDGAFGILGHTDEATIQLYDLIDRSLQFASRVVIENHKFPRILVTTKGIQRNGVITTSSRSKMQLTESDGSLRIVESPIFFFLKSEEIKETQSRIGRELLVEEANNLLKSLGKNTLIPHF